MILRALGSTHFGPPHVLEREADGVLALRVNLRRCHRTQLLWPERVVVELVSANDGSLLLLFRCWPHSTLLLQYERLLEYAADAMRILS